MVCPICESTNVKLIFKFKNRPYSIFWKNRDLPTLNLKVSKCDNCDFLFQSSAYSKKYDKVMGKIYNSYFIAGDVSKEFPSPKIYYEKELKFLNDNLNLKKIQNVLEIGSSRGDFLYNLKSIYPHLNILGLEPSKLEFVGVPTINSFFKRDLFSNKFDLIIIRHVLEHIKNPKEFIESLKSILSKNGKIFIEVPNTLRDLKDKLEIFSPDHVSYFSASMLQNLLNTQKLYINHILNDSKNHLFALVSTKDSNIVIENENMDKYLNEYKKSLKKSLNFIKECKDYKIVLYGASNMFLWIYSLLNEELKLNNITLIDDDNRRIGKKVLSYEVIDSQKLKRDDKYLFILCSANRKVIDILTNNIKDKFTNYTILLPWYGKLSESL